MFSVFILLCISKYADQTGSPIVCLFDVLVEMVCDLETPESVLSSSV